MNYTHGYVVFMDILGFSNFVLEEQNASAVRDIFQFVEKFQYLFNTSPQLKTKVAFFSDSIVLTTDDNDESLHMIFAAIYLAEIYLKEHTNLHFRGGLTKGAYYHNGSIAFGPAIVKAYQLEGQAKYSRLIIDDSIVEKLDLAPFEIMKDLDGKYYFNTYSYALLDEISDKSKQTKEGIFRIMDRQRSTLVQEIQNHLYTPVIDKYLWRITAYNTVCDNITSMFEALEYDEGDISKVHKLKISLKDLEDKEVI